MIWINIKDDQPAEHQAVLFEDMDGHYHVGFWNDYENAMLQFDDGREGWKWSVVKWTEIISEE